MLDTGVYAGEYLDGHKAPLAANTIATNIFSQVDEEGNKFILFDKIVNNCVDGTDTMHQEAFVITNNWGKIQR